MNKNRIVNRIFFPYKMSVLAIFKNETMNLKVWLDHYLWQGVDHFYLIDNDSNDNPHIILEPYIQKGLVTLHKFPQQHLQIQHYIRLWQLENLSKKTKWLIMADLDEFWFSPNSKLSSIINEYENYDVIYSNWLMFGSDGLTNHPSDIRTAITHRENNIHINTKWICKPIKIRLTDFYHHFFKNDSKYKKKVVNDKIHLNHYSIQSKEYFEKVKIARGDVLEKHNSRDWNYFNNYDKHKTYEDNLLRDMILNKN